MTPDNLVLALLNSRPVIDGTPQDALADDAEGRRWLRTHGGHGSEGELHFTRRARDLLDRVVRGTAPAPTLAEVVARAPGAASRRRRAPVGTRRGRG